MENSHLEREEEYHRFGRLHPTIVNLIVSLLTGSNLENGTSDPIKTGSYDSTHVPRYERVDSRY